MENNYLLNLNLDFYKSNDNFKISSDRIPFNENYSIYDISLKSSKEHLVFHKEFDKYNYITRRGLTFL